ncbi:ribonuclease [Neobacillus notoginsengisoli]|uniref:Ribonuclease n=1 Tax=Neobacillus notoginsengisoli TaxID=1578198 RepID=A0A417YQK1_9BACI|nr:YlzJ-like family protein [Neobacillus notoginsengisoli]RHW36382.1 ribonuclease [Neobacillus notoginsengisoli]
MILYTMMPEELIYPPVDSLNADRQIIQVDGVPLEAEQDGQGYTIVRILSTDPAHFMDSRFMPGSKISG